MNSIINAFQSILNSVELLKTFASPQEEFAVKRFSKKFEIPTAGSDIKKRENAFNTWLSVDEAIQAVRLPPGNWYKARLSVQKALKEFRLGKLEFTGGSSSDSLYGKQSIADKLLTHKWEVSPNCVDLFCKLAVDDHAFVRAAKMRARKSLGDDYRATCMRIYSYRKRPRDVKEYLLRLSLTSREASRWSSVPKNNETDRSIDLQPFINMVVQRAIGVGLSEVLKKHFGIDLTKAQDVHRRLISDVDTYATIDLRNASDSNSRSLVSFLYPKWFVSLLEQAIPDYVEAPNGHYYITKKISSMGNGFTFELMTLTLTALVRVHSETSCVFGDDIIVPNTCAPEVISDLRGGGWVVNESKTFIDGPFRESCGANYHKQFGYLKSFDFRYPSTISDCLVFLNKAFLLRGFPFFKKLHDKLYRTVPIALRGPSRLEDDWVGQPLEEDLLNVYAFAKKVKMNNEPFFKPYATDVCWPEWHCHKGLAWSSSVRTQSRRTLTMRKHTLLFMHYMSSNGVSNIPLTGRGDWILVDFVSNGSWSVRTRNFTKSN